MSDIRNDDNVQHGIDDNPNDDAAKGLELGALGGGAAGAIAGAALGPVGMIVGALIGGSIGSVASGAAVQAVDAVDNDNTVSGVGDGATLKGDLTGERSLSTPDVYGGTSGGAMTGASAPDVHAGTTGGISQGATAAGDYERGSYVGGSDIADTGASALGTDAGGHNIVTSDEARTDAGKTGLGAGAVAGGLLGAAAGGPVGAVVGGVLGSLTGGVAGDATEAAAEKTGNLDMNNTSVGIQTGTTPDVHAGNERYAQLTSGDYATRPYGTYEGRSISRTDYNALPENDRMRVQLVEEELHVDKEVRQIGEVEISKRVVSEQVSVPVTLEREEVIIHRTNVTGGAAGTIGADQTIVVPISEEFANVTKTAHVTGEVEVEKRMTSEQKTISDTVRHEELEVNQGTTGRVTIEDDTTKGKM